MTDLITARNMTANLKHLVSIATNEEFIAGKSWYREAHDIAAMLAQNSTLSISQTAAIIAVLSPRMSWVRNVELAKYFVETGKTMTPDGKNIHTKQQIAKLKAIVKAGSIVAIERQSAIEKIICKDYGKTGKNGQLLKAGLPNKTLNFFWNIVNANSNHVTVDAHAAGAALMSFDSYDNRGVMAVRLYQEIASAYIMVAHDMSILPSQLQAIVWLVYRRVLGDNRD